MITRPMLAVVVSPNQLKDLQYPQFASVKFDGIRCLMHPTLGPVSRSFKPLANVRVREWLEQHNLEYMDGEILLHRDDGPPFTYNDVQSFVNSDLKSLPPNWWMTFNVFDFFKDPDVEYEKRLGRLADRMHPGIATDGKNHVVLVHQELCYNEHQVMSYYERCIQEGHEGIMVRRVDAPYKSGRSTLKQQYLLKLKPVHEDEGTIVEFNALFTNENEAEEDMFGLVKRSSRKEGRVEQELLGALVVDTPQWGTVRIGSGFTAEQRRTFWRIREKLQGKKVLFRYQSVGMQDKPRFPRYVKLMEKVT